MQDQVLWVLCWSTVFGLALQVMVVRLGVRSKQRQLHMQIERR